MRRRWHLRTAAVVAAASVVVAACSGDPSPVLDGATSESVTAAPTSATMTTTDPMVAPEGFDLIAGTVVTAEGEECEVCLWLAASADQRRRGLMGVTDLGAGDAMAFVYPGPHTGSFWMKNTLLPLSIAFFDIDGQFVDSFDMEPCTDDPCRQYPTPRDIVVAVEVVRGELGELGIGPGSELRLTDLPCG